MPTYNIPIPTIIVIMIKHSFGSQWLWLSHDVCCVLRRCGVKVANVPKA